MLNPSKRNSFFIFGARGAGKSTLLRSLFTVNEALWIDLLSPVEEQKYLLNPERLEQEWQQNKKPWIVIDEVQKLPKLLDIVHRMIENDRVFFALTGSSARKLKRGQANLLAGRAFTFHLFPLCVEELKDQFDLKQALSFGTLPKINSFEFDADRVFFLNSYAQTYLKEEILVEQILRKIEPFRKFLPVAARSAGRPLNYAKIGRDSGVDPKSVDRYFSILQDTLLGFFLDSYHASVRKKQRAAPKFYFFDVGVQRSLAQMLDVEVNPKTSYYGEIFESFLISEIHRIEQYHQKGFELSYLSDGANLEIDLLIEKAGRVIALVEIKSSEFVQSDSLRSLRAVANDFPDAARFVLSQETVARKTEDGIVIYPWREGLHAIVACGSQQTHGAPSD